MTEVYKCVIKLLVRTSDAFPSTFSYLPQSLFPYHYFKYLPPSLVTGHYSHPHFTKDGTNKLHAAKTPESQHSTLTTTSLSALDHFDVFFGLFCFFPVSLCGTMNLKLQLCSKVFKQIKAQVPGTLLKQPTKKHITQPPLFGQWDYIYKARSLESQFRFISLSNGLFI